MSQPFLGEIRMFAGNFPPLNWMLCDGSLLPITRNTALFSLLGTSFGGNGTTTFGLPNLIDAVPVGTGAGPGLSQRSLGESGGSATVSLTSAQMAPHTHAPAALAGAGLETSPEAAVWATSTGRDNQYATGTPDTQMAPAIGASGNGTPHENRAPYLAVTYIICISGLFPPRP